MPNKQPPHQPLSLPSIRQRITRSLIFISLAWGISVSGVVWAAINYSINDLLDGALQESAEVLFGLLVTHQDTLPVHDGGALPAPVHEESLVWQLVGIDQVVQLRSHKAPTRPLLPAWKSGISDAGADWRVYGMPLTSGKSILYVGQRTADRRSASIEAAAVTALCTLVVGLAFVILLRRQIRRELLHLQQLSKNVSDYDPVRSGKGLLAVTRAELQPIHRAITDLASRLSRHVANERAFSAHAAHALRTPLAGMDVQLAMALRECTPELRPRLQRTRDAANRLTRVVSALLTLFRSGSELHLQQLDLAALVERLPVELTSIEVKSTTLIEADPDLLAAALMNLLDNAVRHGAHQISMVVRASDRRQMIFLHDDGPGISAEKRQTLQKALKAQDYENGQLGLGLMLADLVARAHGGSLRILPASTGFAIVLRLGSPQIGTLSIK